MGAMMFALLVAWTSLRAFAADCERPTTGVEVEQAVARARAAYAEEDPVALAASVVDARVAAQCLVEPAPSELADALHLAQGLWAAVETGDEAAVPYLAAGRLQRGTRVMAPDLTDAETQLIARVGPALDPWTTVAGPRLAPSLRGRVNLDGDRSVRRVPVNEPFLFQHLRGGTVLATEYLPPGRTPPPYRRMRPAITWTGVGLGVAGAGLLTGAALTRAELYADHPAPLTDDEVRGIARRNHAFLGAAAVASGLSVVSFGALAVSYRF